jgi:hypothetical protein
MTRPSTRLAPSFTFVAACAAALVAWHSTTASADPPSGAPAAGAYASGSPSTLPPDEEPLPVASGARPPHVPDFAAPAPPETRSDEPTRAEWADAPPAEGVRITDPSCKVQRIREWYRVRCGDEQVSVVTGPKTDLDIERISEDEVAAVFPVRRGDARMLVFAYLFKWGFVQDAVVSAQWLEGDPAPLVTVVGVPHGGL